MNQLEQHAHIPVPEGNPECLKRIIDIAPLDSPVTHRSAIHHAVRQRITANYTVPLSSATWNVLAIDPGTAQLGWALIQCQGLGGRHIRRMGTIRGADTPLGCHEAFTRILRACHPHFPTVVLLEVPAARYYGRGNSSNLCKVCQQVCFLAQSVHMAFLLASQQPFVDYVDSYEWNQYMPAGTGRHRQFADKDKAAVFSDVFGHWKDETNNHERDAALMGHWWASVLVMERAPNWSYGIKGV